MLCLPQMIATSHFVISEVVWLRYFVSHQPHWRTEISYFLENVTMIINITDQYRILTLTVSSVIFTIFDQKHVHFVISGFTILRLSLHIQNTATDFYCLETLIILNKSAYIFINTRAHANYVGWRFGRISCLVEVDSTFSFCHV